MLLFSYDIFGWSTDPDPRWEDGILRNRYRQCQYLADLFWKRFKREYLVILSQRQKWIRPRRNLKAGDLVLVVDANTPRSTWPLARVVKTFPGRDGRVRNCQIQTSQNVFERPIQKLVLLEGQEWRRRLRRKNRKLSIARYFDFTFK